MDSKLDVGVSQVVTDDEVEKKLEQISGLAFGLLTKQLEEQHQALCKLIKEAKTIESKSSSYSTQALQKKLFQGLSAELKLADQNPPLDTLQQKENTEYESVLKIINEIKEQYKEKIQRDLVLEKSAYASIEHMRAPLIERVQQFKKILYQTLQQAAEEYRSYLCQKGEWEKKFPEFMDKFGCVVTIDACRSPYSLKKDHCYGLKFGHKMREARELPLMDSTINILEDKKLVELEQMINDVIAECVYYSNDSYDVLNIIKRNFDRITKEKQRGWFQLEEEGRFYRQLKLFKLLKTEEDIVNAQMKNIETDLKNLAIQRDSLLLKEINESLTSIQNLTSLKIKNTIDCMNVIKQEVAVSVNLLTGQSTKCYKQISVRAGNMKISNAQAKTHSIAASAALHRVQVAYEDAIRMAKQIEKNEFERNEKLMSGSLLESEAEMQIVKENLENLERNEQIIIKQLNYARENYGGSIHRIPEAEFNREYKKYEIQKSSYANVQKEYNIVRVLPKALKAYGDIVFTSAEIQAEIASTNQMLKTVPNLLQSMWAAYNEALQDENDSNGDRYSEYQKTIDNGLVRLHSIQTESNEKLTQVNVVKEAIEKKAQDVHREFSANVSLEFQEYIDTTKMRYTDCIKQKETAEIVITSVKDILKALVEYKEMMFNCRLIRGEIIEAKQAAADANQAAFKVKKLYQDAVGMAKQGVVQPDLEITAMKKYAEAKQAMSFAIERLNKSKERLSEEEKKLNSTKEYFAPELQAKPREIFTEVNQLFSDTDRAKKIAETVFASIQALPQQLHEKMIEAKNIEKEKQIATQLRQLLLNAILNNLSLWRMGKWGGGTNFKYSGKVYRIPHGVLEIINALSTSADYRRWIPKVAKMAGNRHTMGRSNWKYRLFAIRDDTTTGVLYHAIKENLRLNENSIESLRNALLKIPHLELSSNHTPRRYLRA